MLDMNQNLLTELKFIRKLTSLRELNLNDNKLMLISVLDVRGLDNLQVLRLRGNMLVNINFLLITLTMLQVLDVSGEVNFIQNCDLRGEAHHMSSSGGVIFMRSMSLCKVCYSQKCPGWHRAKTHIQML